MKKKAKAKKTDKEKLFIENYLSNGFNATQAYRDAGFQCTIRSATVKGSKLLGKVDIKKEIDKRIDTLLEGKKELSVKWINEIKKLAFSDLRDVVTWGKEGSKPCEECGKKAGGIELKDSKDLDDNIAGTISEVSNTPSGIKVKLASKEKALDLLGKYLSLFTEKIDLNVSGKITLDELKGNIIKTHKDAMKE